MAEKQIERAICERLTLDGHFVVKLKDQALKVGSQYRRGSSFEIRGVSDLLVITQSKGVPVTIYLEVKTETGKQSDAQKRFQEKIEAYGHYYIVCRSHHEAKKKVDAILDKVPPSLV